MNNAPILSIIIPVYNSQKYIKRCFDSIIAQKFTDFEIIVVDDGSNDKSAEILDEYAIKDNRIRVFHIKNRGVSNARNIGLSKATGKYITFVDCDDWVDKYIYKIMISALEENDASFVQCGVNCVHTDSRITHLQKYNYLSTSDNDIILQQYFLGNIYHSVWNKLFKSELLKKTKFDVNYIIGEDAKFVFDVCKNANKVVLLSDTLYNYFIADNSSIHTLLNENHFQPLYLLDEQMKEFVDNNIIYQACIRRQAVLSLDLIKKVLKEDIFTEKLPELRERIVLNKYNIIFSKYYSLKFKAGVIMLSLFPSVFYKIFRKQ